MLKTAMKAEIDSFTERGVYEVIDRDQMETYDNPIVLSTKWVYTNKGSVHSPVAKARLVAREFVSSSIDRDTLFSGTPGLEAMRAVLSHAATRKHGRVKYRVMSLDIKTAFLYGIAVRNLFIELPESDKHFGNPNKVGRLLRSLYGTRDAPQRWRVECDQTLVKLGFLESGVVPGLYAHQEKDIVLCVHVDDFLVAGEEADLRWLQAALEEHYQLKASILGPERHLSQEVSFLKRTIVWADRGIIVRGNTGHAEELIKTMGMQNCKTVSTPMSADDLKDDPAANPEQEQKLEDAEARRFRRCAALTVYMSQDRPDLSCSSCHLARKMSSPSIRDMEKLRRVTKYLRGRPCSEVIYEFQDPVDKLTAFSDSDWANDVRTRRSHSGVAIMRGKHLLGHWTKIQSVIALSSGEAELYASVLGITKLLGLAHLFRSIYGENWGTLEHCMDSSACKSIILRKGSGKIKHLSTKDLWAQEARKRYSIEEVKVNRVENPADLLASYSCPRDMAKQLEILGVRVYAFGSSRWAPSPRSFS